MLKDLKANWLPVTIGAILGFLALPKILGSAGLGAYNFSPEDARRRRSKFIYGRTGSYAMGATNHNAPNWRWNRSLPRALFFKGLHGASAALGGGSTGWNPNFGYWRPTGNYSIGNQRLGGGFQSIPIDLLPFGLYPFFDRNPVYGPNRPPL